MFRFSECSRCISYRSEGLAGVSFSLLGEAKTCSAGSSSQGIVLAHLVWWHHLLNSTNFIGIWLNSVFIHQLAKKVDTPLIDLTPLYTQCDTCFLLRRVRTAINRWSCSSWVFRSPVCRPQDTMPSISPRISVILLWKCSGTHVIPNGNRLKQNLPTGVIKVVSLAVSDLVPSASIEF